jgi:DNA-binding NtrC family response regulator
LLTLFELTFRRGALDKAARVCEEAIEMIEQAGADRHAQMMELWRNLLTLVNARRLTEQGLLEARHSLVRCWAASAQARPLELPGVAWKSELPDPAPESHPSQQFLAPAPPPAPAHLAPGDYEEALERYDREVIAAGLAQGQGRIGETSRLLGIDRRTLQAKMKRYRLRGQ